MKLACPHCNFSRDVPAGQIPDRPVKVTCPRCQQGFVFDKTAASPTPAGSAAPGETAGSTADRAEQATTCPACGFIQPAGDVCTACGVIYAKWAARHEARAEAPRDETIRPGSPPAHAHRIICDSCGAVQPPGHLCVNCGAVMVTMATGGVPQRFAGFWVRVAASMIDGLLLGAVQFVFSLALNLAGGTSNAFASGGGLALLAITWLCSVMVSVTYYVFFTGYNGQTPGKMALRIQVVRIDGTPMNYGRAFLREVVGKFLSGIILGIGYLMVAFDRQKQGLHDRIAGTYVIKL